MIKRLIALFTLASASLLAQPAEQLTFYKLDFVIKEVEGTQALSSKTYSTLAPLGNSKSTIRTGSKVPVLSSPGSSQWSYVEVGINIDCSGIKETGSGLALTVTADFSTLPAGPPATPNATSIRQLRWSAEVVVPFKKTTLLFSSDDPSSKRQMQLELTATPVK